MLNSLKGWEEDISLQNRGKRQFLDRWTELWGTTKSLYRLTNVKSEIFVRCSNSMGRNSRVPYFHKSIHSSSVSSLKAALAFSGSYRVYRLNSWTRDSKRMRDFCLAFLHPWKIHLGLFARLLNGVCRWLCNYFVNTPIGLLFSLFPFFPWACSMVVALTNVWFSFPMNYMHCDRVFSRFSSIDMGEEIVCGLSESFLCFKRILEGQVE